MKYALTCNQDRYDEAKDLDIYRGAEINISATGDPAVDVSSITCAANPFPLSKHNRGPDLARDVERFSRRSLL